MVLVFDPIISGDDGKYMCRASNRGGADQLEAVIKVQAIGAEFGGMGSAGFAGLMVFIAVLIICLFGAFMYARKLSKDVSLAEASSRDLNSRV
jgi:hypothetical protein